MLRVPEVTEAVTGDAFLQVCVLLKRGDAKILLDLKRKAGKQSG